jgi:hypothetical protein
MFRNVDSRRITTFFCRWKGRFHAKTSSQRVSTASFPWVFCPKHVCFVCASVRACVRACVHTHIHTNIHMYIIYTLIHLNIHYINTYIHTFMHTFMHACIRTTIHTCMLAYIQRRGIQQSASFKPRPGADSEQWSWKALVRTTFMYVSWYTFVCMFVHVCVCVCECMRVCMYVRHYQDRKKLGVCVHVLCF